MIDLLSAIVSSISALLNLIVSTLTSFINLLVNIPTYVTFLTNSIGYLPETISIFCVASISIVIVLFIIGR